MKTFLTIFSCVLFLSAVFMVPADDAPLSTLIPWAIWVYSILFLVSKIWRELEQWDKDDNGKK